MKRIGGCAVIGWTVLLTVRVASAQETPPPAEPRETLSAKIIELEGSAFYAPAGAGPLDAEAWKPAKVGDEYPSGTQIRTALRTRVLLQFGDDTLVLVDRLTLASIDQFYKQADLKKTELSLGYGKLRVGVAEGALRSDLTIDSPVATLSKKGTWGMEMEVQRGGYYRFALTDRGLLEALVKATGQRRLINPGRFVNALTVGRMWIMQHTFERNVSMFDLASLSGAEVHFNVVNNTGLGVVDPAAGIQTTGMAGRDTRALFEQLAAQGEFEELSPEVVARLREAGFLLNRLEGNFGFGGSFGLIGLLQQSRQVRKELHDRFGPRFRDRR